MIIKFFDQLRNTTSRTEKVRWLAQADPLVKDILLHTYDPFRRWNFARQTNISYCRTAPVGTFEDLWNRAKSILTRAQQRQLTPNQAWQLFAALPAVSDEEWELLLGVLAKDLRLGCDVKTINKALPGLIPEFSVQLAEQWDPKRFPSNAWGEPKIDGMRILANVAGQRATLLTRSGHQVENCPHIETALVRFFGDDLASDTGKRVDVTLDGELFFKDFKTTMQLARRKANSPELEFLIWGWWEAGSPGTHGQNRPFFQDEPPLRFIPGCPLFTIEEAEQQFRDYRRRGYEGLIVKDLNAKWEPRRSFSWMKMKGEVTFDLRVTDMQGGTGKYLGMLGALICDFNGTEVSVGTGFTDAERIDFSDGSLLGCIVEVGAMEVTPDGSLRHPRFIRLRPDKGDFE